MNDVTDATRLLDWDKLLYINPQKVSFGACNIYFEINAKKTVDDGDWDLNLYKLEVTPVYKSIHAMIKKNTPWEKTVLYEWMMDKVNRNIVSEQRGCSTKEMVIMRGAQILQLCKNIERGGEVKSQRQLKEDSSTNKIDLNNEIAVAIDRNGKFIFANNGIHRLCIAKVLGYKQVPVLVYKRHKIWEDFRSDVYAECNKFWNKKAYQKLCHPDFDEMPTEWDDTRYNIIKPLVNPNSKTVLDIGSMFGYFCHKFENDGFDCTAVEATKDYLKILDKIKNSSGMNFSIFSDDIFKLKNTDYDIILALNIFHHFIKTEAMHQKLIEFLNRMNYREMYVQFHTPNEPQMQNAYRNYNNMEFVEFILKNSRNKTKYQFVKEIRKRNLYKIY